MTFETTLLSELTVYDFLYIMNGFMFLALSVFFMLKFILNVMLKALFELTRWLFDSAVRRHAQQTIPVTVEAEE